MADEVKGEKPKKKGVLTRFRQDRRLAVTGTLRSLALLCILGSVIFCIWNYRADLNPASLKRIASYIGASMGESSEFQEYKFESGLQTVYQPFGIGLAVASGDTFRFISGLGDDDFSFQLKYAEPVIRTSNDSVLIFDRGNFGLTIAGSYSIISQKTFSSPIIDAQMNTRGDCAVATRESGYRGAVTFFDDNQRQQFKWQTPDFYIMRVSCNESGDGFATLCLSESGGKSSMCIKGFDIDKKEAVFTAELGEISVYSMAHYKNDQLIIVCESGVLVFDENGKQTAQYSCEGELYMLSHSAGQLPLLAMRTATGVGEHTRVAVIDENGKAIFLATYDGNIKDVAFQKGRAALLFKENIITVDVFEPEQPQQERKSSGAREVMLDGRGNPLLFYGDRAVKIS